MVPEINMAFYFTGANFNFLGSFVTHTQNDMYSIT